MTNMDNGRFRVLLTVFVLCVGLLLLAAGRLSAQEAGDGATETPTAPDAPEAPAAVDPGDEIVAHIQAMTAIVKDNMDKPDTVKTSLKAYIGENGEAMKVAGDKFEEQLNTMTPSDAEAYRETLQRKMEKSLEDFLKTMLDFSERHPEAAKELDELLQKMN